MKISIFQSKIFFLISGFLTFILCYIVLSNVPGGFLFPSFSKIIDSIIYLITKENIIFLFIKTIFEVLICILVSFVIGLMLAYLRMYLKNAHEFLTPFLAFIKCAPLSILIVYFFFIFGQAKGPYIICLLVVLPLILESIFTSQNEIRKEINLELSITNVSKFKKFFMIILPLISPYLTMSFLMSFGLGLKVIVMGEYLMATPDSLGLFIYNAKSALEIDTLLGILILCVIFTLLFEILAKILFKALKKKLFG